LGDLIKLLMILFAEFEKDDIVIDQRRYKEDIPW
jgi:hypothetical protein